MADYMFRDLRADEIDCRVAQAKETGVSLLLYKDARCDQAILDETVGPMGWQRYHSRDNANCTVQIWDAGKGQWIGKEDTGTESNTEKEKGLASDSFKRACFNWGIGRELYTAPFIWIKAQDCEDLKPHGTDRNGKAVWKCRDAFEVASIAIEEKRIVALEIRHAKSGAIVFHFGQTASKVACEDCGKVIAGYTGPNGRPVSVKRHCVASKERYGRVLCLDCISGVQANTTPVGGDC